jgi:hypothetical protein
LREATPLLEQEGSCGIKKMSEATKAPQTGWSVRRRCFIRSEFRILSDISCVPFVQVRVYFEMSLTGVRDFQKSRLSTYTNSTTSVPT